MQTDHEFITPTEKTLCQVHLVSEQVRGDLQLCSHTKESRVKNLAPTETVFPWHIEHFKEKMNHCPDSVNRKMTRRLILEEQKDHLLSEARSEVLKQECRADFSRLFYS